MTGGSTGGDLPEGAPGGGPVRSKPPGLARERTVLAWYRSGLAVVVSVAVLLRHIWPLQTTDQDIALGLTAGAVMVWALVLLRLTSRASIDPRLARAPRVFGLMTAGTVLLAIVAFVLTFFPA